MPGCPRAPVLAAPLLISLLATGCPGSFSFSKLDVFEEARSAVWLEQQIQSPWAGEMVYHVLVLSPEPGLCDAYQAAYAAYNERMAELDAAFDGETQCALWRDAFGALSTHLGPYAGPDTALIKLSFLEYGEYGQIGVEPEDEAYAFSDDLDHVAYLSVELFHEDVYAWAAEDFRVVDGTCTSFGYLVPIVGLDVPAAGPDVVETYFGSSGTATAEHRGSSRIHVDLDARLWKDGGEVQGQFTARHCAITIDGVGGE